MKTCGPGLLLVVLIGVSAFCTGLSASKDAILEFTVKWVPAAASMVAVAILFAMILGAPITTVVAYLLNPRDMHKDDTVVKPAEEAEPAAADPKQD